MKGIFHNNQFLKLFSIIAAVLFWFIIITNVTPDSDYAVKDIDVVISDSNAILTKYDLHVIDQKTKTIKIKVHGPRYLIGKLKPADFVVKPQLGNVKKAGTYNIPVAADLAVFDQRIRIKNINPANITVRFDKLVTKVMAVEPKINENAIANGYVADTMTANPSSIEITGPEWDVSRITKVQADVKLDNNTSSEVLKNSKLIMLDSKSDPVNTEHIKISNSEAEITIPVLYKKALPLKLNFINIPAGFNSNNIEYDITPTSVSAAGSEELLKMTNDISLGSIDFSKLDITNQIGMPIKMPILIKDLSNTGNATVSVKLKNTSTKLISTDQFSVVNLPSNRRAFIWTKQINNIKLFGPSNDINNIGTVTAVIDISKAQGATGRVEIPVSITVPGKTGYWVTGQYKAVVWISRKW